MEEQIQPANTPHLSPTVPPISKTKSKLPFIIGGIILIALVSSGVYYLGIRNTQSAPEQIAPLLSPTTIVTDTINPSPTSQIPTSMPTTVWQTYTSQEFNYSIKYPPHLEAENDTPYSVLFSQKQTQPGAASFPPLYVSVIPDGFSNTNAEVYNYMSADNINSFFSMRVGESKQIQADSYGKLPDIIIAGQPAVVIESYIQSGGGGVPLIDKRIYIKKNGYTYMIGGYYFDAGDDFQTSLSAFAFTK